MHNQYTHCPECGIDLEDSWLWDNATAEERAAIAEELRRARRKIKLERLLRVRQLLREGDIDGYRRERGAWYRYSTTMRFAEHTILEHAEALHVLSKFAELKPLPPDGSGHVTFHRPIPYGGGEQEEIDEAAAEILSGTRP